MNMPIPQQRTFTPDQSGVAALLDKLYHVKFSRHTPLVVVLLSMIYTIYRSSHYLANIFKLEWYIAWPTALFLELIVLASAASVFLALRADYVAQLNKLDEEIARWGVHISLGVLIVAIFAMLIVAWGDAWNVTNAYAPAFVMVLIQAVQAALIALFIIMAILDERHDLRLEYAKKRQQQAYKSANSCRYCGTDMAPNNLARHEASCRANPANGSQV